MKGTDNVPLEVCHNVPQVTTSTQPSSSTPPHPPSPTLATSALTKGLHPAFIMHSTNRPFPSSRMFSAALPPASTSSLPAAQQGSGTADPGPTSPYDAFREGGGSSGGGGGGGGGSGSVANALAQAYSISSQPNMANAQAAASLAYAAHLQQGGFPYGISGVPMPGYGYSGEMYKYATNGVPRKSRKCSICNKTFTRSTTRRYHEQRCPLLRAASSLIKGKTSTSPVKGASADGLGSDAFDATNAGGGEGKLSQLPPLVAATRDPSPPPSALSTSTPTSSSATSVRSSSQARPHMLTSSPFYSMYGSHPLPSTASTSAASLASQEAVSAKAQSIVEQIRSTVLSSAKPGSEAESMDIAMNSHADRARRESDLLVDKVRSHNEEQGQRQHSTFSPHSPNSHSLSGSKSDDEDRESEEGEMERFKSPLGMPMRTEHDPMSNSTNKQPYLAHMASLQPAQKMLSGTDKPLFAASYMTSMASPSRKTEFNMEMPYGPTDKEDRYFQDTDSSFQEREDINDYSQSQVIFETDEAEFKQRKMCDVCKTEFSQEEQRMVHERVHQKYRPNSCRFCGQRFLKPSKRIAHQRLHESKFSLKCVVCGLQVASRFGMRQHMHRAHYYPVEEGIPCRLCSFVIESVYDLRSHYLSHCDKMSSSERLSIRYLPSPPVARSESPMEEEGPQELPPTSIDSKTSPDSPGEVLSESPPPHRSGTPTSVNEDNPSGVNGSNEPGGSREKEWCRLCQKEFPKSYMRYHERQHADQKPYECKLCHKRFGYKNNMKSHMKLHDGIKRYQCVICLGKFTRRSTLRRHARRHENGNDAIRNFQDRAMLNQASAHEVALATVASVKGVGSPPVAGSRAMKADPVLMASMVKPDLVTAAQNFDLRNFPVSSSFPKTMFNAFTGLSSAVTQTMFQPYMSAQQYLDLTSGFPSTAPPAPVTQQAEQVDALDFSMQRQRNSPSSTSTPRPPSAASQSQGSGLPGSSVSRSSSASGQPCPDRILDRRCVSRQGDRSMERVEEGFRSADSYHHHHPRQRASLGETVERLMETRSNRDTQPASVSHDSSTQVTLCCASPSPHSMAGHKEPMASPAMSAAFHEAYQHQSIADLMTAGLLFRCPHCDCYFTDRTMYRVHQKVHLPDHPFVCFICQEDCQDRTTFSKHLIVHLR